MIVHYQFAKRWEHLELDYTSHDGVGMSWRMIRIKYDFASSHNSFKLRLCCVCAKNTSLQTRLMESRSYFSYHKKFDQPTLSVPPLVIPAGRGIELHWTVCVRDNLISTAHYV